MLDGWHSLTHTHCFLLLCACLLYTTTTDHSVSTKQAFGIFYWWQIGSDACFFVLTSWFLYLRMAISVFMLVQQGLFVWPVYSLVVQMGSQYNDLILAKLVLQHKARVRKQFRTAMKASILDLRSHGLMPSKGSHASSQLSMASAASATRHHNPLSGQEGESGSGSGGAHMPRRSAAAGASSTSVRRGSGTDEGIATGSAKWGSSSFGGGGDGVGHASAKRGKRLRVSSSTMVVESLSMSSSPMGSAAAPLESTGTRRRQLASVQLTKHRLVGQQHGHTLSPLAPGVSTASMKSSASSQYAPAVASHMVSQSQLSVHVDAQGSRSSMPGAMPTKGSGGSFEQYSGQDHQPGAIGSSAASSPTAALLEEAAQTLAEGDDGGVPPRHHSSSYHVHDKDLRHLAKHAISSDSTPRVEHVVALSDEQVDSLTASGLLAARPQSAIEQ